MSELDNGRMKLTPAQRRILAQIAGARRVVKYAGVGTLSDTYYSDGERLSLLPMYRLLELRLVEEFIPSMEASHREVRLTEAGRAALA